MGVLKDLQNALGPKVLTGDSVSERYEHIWTMDVPLQAKAVILPRSTEDVSSAMAICYAHEQPVAIHGGLTNLVGSTETDPEEVVISLEKMNDIEEVDTGSRTMSVQSGVILENIQRTALEHELIFPLNFGAKGSAQIGGIISTNAGGLRVLKYGMTRSLVLGLEVVLADGTVINSMKKIIKDNSAYDLKQIFIGSEGTLGIVTRAVLRLLEAPSSRISSFAGLDDFDSAVRLLKHMDAGLAGNLSGFELMWDKTYEACTSPPAQLKPPLPHGFKYYVLIESLGNDPATDLEKMESLLETALNEGMIKDAVLASNEADLNWFWSIREDVHVFVSQIDHEQHFDVSLPTPQIGNYADNVIHELLQIPEVTRVFTFGHVADGNIHFIIGKNAQGPALIERINQVVYTPLSALGGSVSAEHGIGIHKKQYLDLCRSDQEIELMRTLKKSLDPRLILNRRKVIDC